MLAEKLKPIQRHPESFGCLTDYNIPRTCLFSVSSYLDSTDDSSSSWLGYSAFGLQVAPEDRGNSWSSRRFRASASMMCSDFTRICPRKAPIHQFFTKPFPWMGPGFETYPGKEVFPLRFCLTYTWNMEGPDPACVPSSTPLMLFPLKAGRAQGPVPPDSWLCFHLT